MIARTEAPKVEAVRARTVVATKAIGVMGPAEMPAVVRAVMRPAATAAGIPVALLRVQAAASVAGTPTDPVLAAAIAGGRPLIGLRAATGAIQRADGRTAFVEMVTAVVTAVASQEVLIEVGPSGVALTARAGTGGIAAATAPPGVLSVGTARGGPLGPATATAPRGVIPKVVGIAVDRAPVDIAAVEMVIVLPGVAMVTDRPVGTTLLAAVRTPGETADLAVMMTPAGQVVTDSQLVAPVVMAVVPARPGTARTGRRAETVPLEVEASAVRALMARVLMELGASDLVATQTEEASVAKVDTAQQILPAAVDTAEIVVRRNDHRADTGMTVDRTDRFPIGHPVVTEIVLPGPGLDPTVDDQAAIARVIGRLAIGRHQVTEASDAIARLVVSAAAIHSIVEWEAETRGPRVMTGRVTTGRAMTGRVTTGLGKTALAGMIAGRPMTARIKNAQPVDGRLTTGAAGIDPKGQRAISNVRLGTNVRPVKNARPARTSRDIKRSVHPSAAI